MYIFTSDKNVKIYIYKKKIEGLNMEYRQRARFFLTTQL